MQLLGGLCSGSSAAIFPLNCSNVDRGSGGRALITTPFLQFSQQEPTPKVRRHFITTFFMYRDFSLVYTVDQYKIYIYIKKWKRVYRLD